MFKQRSDIILTPTQVGLNDDTDVLKAFFPELMDYVRLASVPSLVATVLVVPLAVFVWNRRAPVGRWQLALGGLSVLAYGASNFIAIAYYSLRIT